MNLCEMKMIYELIFQIDFTKKKTIFFTLKVHVQLFKGSKYKKYREMGKNLNNALKEISFLTF